MVGYWYCYLLRNCCIYRFYGETMKLQKNPNLWSCLPASFATVLNIDLSEILTKLKHDGSKILWPDLPEPMCRQSFHVQELILYSFIYHNYLTVTLDMIPESAPSVKDNLIESNKLFKHQRIIIELMSEYDGVVTGKTHKGVGHALAWCSKENRSYDSGGYITDPFNDFNIETFYLMRELI